MPTYLRVSNLERYQHYKNRNPPWVKLYASILTDYEFSHLNDASKWLQVGIILLASQHHNQIPDDPKWIKSRLSMTSTPDLDSLETAGFIIREHFASDLLAEAEYASIPLAPDKQNGVSERETEESREETDGHSASERPMTGKMLRGVWAKGFQKFWESWPRKVAKQQAFRQWIKLTPATRDEFGPKYNAIMLLLKLHNKKEFEQREKDKIPHPASWLNRESFERDDVKEAYAEAR